MNWFWSLEEFYKVAWKLTWEFVFDNPDFTFAVMVTLLVVLAGEIGSHIKSDKGGD